MRLIDADAFIEYLGLDAENAREDNVGEIVTLEDFDRQPTAFDKEKVIEALVELRQREYKDSDEEPETIDGEEIYDEGRSQGKFEAYHRAIGIVEKGGIE